MERDGKTYCDKHPNIESSLRCSKCEAYICPKCAVLTPVGYRCRSCGLERSATQSLSFVQSLGGSIVGFVIGFAASFIIPSALGFFLIFAAAIVGGFCGQLVSRTIGRKSSPVVGAITALGFLLGATAPALQTAAATGIPALSAISLHMWPLLFGVIAGAVAWVQLK